MASSERRSPRPRGRGSLLERLVDGTAVGPGGAIVRDLAAALGHGGGLDADPRRHPRVARSIAALGARLAAITDPDRPDRGLAAAIESIVRDAEPRLDPSSIRATVAPVGAVGAVGRLGIVVEARRRANLEPAEPALDAIRVELELVGDRWTPVIARS